MWATRTLKEYLIKGFAMNDELLKRAGGGTTTMYVQGQGKDGIVNYPCNGVSSNTYVEYEGSFTERSLPTFFVIREK